MVKLFKFFDNPIVAGIALLAVTQMLVPELEKRAKGSGLIKPDASDS